MIFRTITDDITGANKSIRLFGMSINEIKGAINLFKEKGIISTLFNTPLFNIDLQTINKYNSAINASIPFEKALNEARKTANADTIALIESSKGLEIQTEQITAVLQASTLAAKAQSIALKTLSVSGSMIAMWAIGKGIELTVKAIDNYVHRAEKAKERTSELFDEFQKRNDALAEHKKTVSELADRYDELSKGVNLSTNENKLLSTEDYKTFLEINKQLADSFPTLAKGIDINGNSILTLGANGMTAKEQLEELLQTEEELNNFKISENLSDAFKGVYAYVKETNAATDDFNDFTQDLNDPMSKIQDIAENGIKLSDDDFQLIFEGNINNQVELEYMNALTKSANDFWKSLDNSRSAELIAKGTEVSNLFTFNADENADTPGAYKVYSRTYGLTPEERTKLEAIIQNNVSVMNGVLLDSIDAESQQLKEKIQQGKYAWTDFIPNLIAGMKSRQTFKNLNPDLQNIAIKIVEGIDYSYSAEMEEYDPDPYAYIRDKLIVPMSELSDSDQKTLKSAFEDLFKLDIKNLPISQLNDKINQNMSVIAGLLDFDQEELKINLGFEFDNVEERLKNSIQAIAYSTEDSLLLNLGLGVASCNGLEEYTKNFTKEQTEFWLESTNGAKNAEEAIRQYEKALEETQNTHPLLSFTDAVSQIQTLSNGFDQLGKIYADVSDKGNFDWSSMLNNDEFKTIFGNFTKEYDNFIKTASNAPDDVNACQSGDRLPQQLRCNKKFVR